MRQDATKNCQVRTDSATNGRKTESLSCEGLLLIECKQVYINGAREHFRQYYNIMDFSMLMLYLASYALRFAAYHRVTEASFYFNASARIEQAVVDCNFSQMNELIWETADRRHQQYGYFTVARTLTTNQY